MKPTDNNNLPPMTPSSAEYARLKNREQVLADIFREICARECPEFTITPDNRETLLRIFYYCLGDTQLAEPPSLDGLFDQNKGIWIWGDIGCGKSSMLRFASNYQRTLYAIHRWMGDDSPRPRTSGFRIYNCSRLATAYATRGLQALDTTTDNQGDPATAAFDELGRECTSAKYFGTPLNVMEFILQLRYDLRDKCLTHVTTNLTPEGVQKLYGSYIYDRMHEMFNVVHLTGKSFRDSGYWHKT